MDWTKVIKSPVRCRWSRCFSIPGVRFPMIWAAEICLSIENLEQSVANGLEHLKSQSFMASHHQIKTHTSEVVWISRKPKFRSRAWWKHINSKAIQSCIIDPGVRPNQMQWDSGFCFRNHHGHLEKRVFYIHTRPWQPKKICSHRSDQPRRTHRHTFR